MKRVAGSAAIMMLLTLGATAPAVVPAWLYPPEASSIARPPALQDLPGSALRPALAQFQDMTGAIDWYPGDHPAPPAAVLHGQGGAYACAFCHLPNGAGRPENASLAGLDAAYIVRAVHAYADGNRDSAEPGSVPTKYMRSIAQAITTRDDDLEAAAGYFAGLPRRSFGKVVEAAQIPAVVGDSRVWRADPAGGRVALGQRLIEMPDDFARFRARDSHLTYTAYVPPGSIARGQRLAQGQGGAAACGACHGTDYAGTSIAPPLAGRSPSYIARQLVNYRAGARHDGAAELMRPVAKGLSDDDVIALAAYMASRPIGSTH